MDWVKMWLTEMDLARMGLREMDLRKWIFDEGLVD